MRLEDLPCIYLDGFCTNAQIEDAFGRALAINVEHIDVISVEDDDFSEDYKLIIDRADYKEGCFKTELCFIHWINMPEPITMNHIWEICQELSLHLKCRVLTDGDFVDITDVHEYVFENGGLVSKVISMEPESFDGKGLVIMKTL